MSNLSLLLYTKLSSLKGIKYYTTILHWFGFVVVIVYCARRMKQAVMEEGLVCYYTKIKIKVGLRFYIQNIVEVDLSLDTIVFLSRTTVPVHTSILM